MSGQTIDRDAFEVLRSMTEAGFLQELIDVFMADSPEQVATMRAALAASDCERLRRAAHSLKSNAASFGANRLAGLAREVELMAKDGKLGGAGERIDALEAEYNFVAPELMELRNG